MMKTMLNRENLALALAVNVLPPQLDTHVNRQHVQIRSARGKWTIAPVHIGEGLPADVRRWLEGRTPASGEEIPVLTARQMSRGARKMLEERGLSWADGSGSAVIQDGAGLYIARLSPTKRLHDRLMTWSPAVAATAEVALEQRRLDADGRAKVQRPSSIAEITGYSYAQTSKALSTFDEQGYTAKVGAERGTSARREFVDPGRLLSDWAGYQLRSGVTSTAYRFHVPWRSGEQSVQLLSRTLTVDWVISGAVAANRLAPYLTQTPDLLVYVRAEELEVARRSLLTDEEVTEVASNGRITVCPGSPQVLTMASREAHEQLAPAVRIYADLLRMGDRGAEAAEFLRESAIGF